MTTTVSRMIGKEGNSHRSSRFWVEQYAYLLGKLAATREGDGTVLDNSCIILANEQWTAHTTERVPLLMAGGLGGSSEPAAPSISKEARTASSPAC